MAEDCSHKTGRSEDAQAAGGGIAIIRHAELVSASMVRHQSRMRERVPCTYILASQKNGTLYIGVTSNLAARIWQHRNGNTQGFSARYRVYRLVHAEFFDDMANAIAREKQLKRWHRAWKIGLIEAANPDWHDLAVTFGIAEPLRHGC